MPSSRSHSPDSAILLVGGRSTRLGTITSQVPKALLPVAGRPFVFHVLDYLIGQGIKRVILATGYLASEFEKALGLRYRSLAVSYSRETSPLGTGGAVVAALQLVNDPTVLVLNGDTYFPVDLAELTTVYRQQTAALAMVLRHVPDVSRYGSLTVAHGVLTAMHEKGPSGPGLINGGIYLIDRPALQGAAPAGPFSLERDLLPAWIQRGKVGGSVFDAYFVDIGIPADLKRAQTELGEYLKFGNPPRL